ncbi:MAG: SgcJ/EcaC family oxidoreductase [Pseudomonadota bacterium]
MGDDEEEVRRVVARADVAFNRGDLETYLDAYEPDVLIMVEPGKALQGRDALRTAMQGIIASGAQVTQLASQVMACGDLALWVSRWRVEWQDRSGRSVLRESCASSLFRKGMDGAWRVVIENPWSPCLRMDFAPRESEVRGAGVQTG